MNQLPFRIRIGVTGHRNNLPDTILLKNKIREVIGIAEWNANHIAGKNSIFSLFDDDSLKQIKKAKNTPITFSIMTALAEGADRVVAETVLEMEGTVLKAVLPLNKKDYLEDFITEDSKNEFEKLLALDYNPLLLRKRRLEEQYELSEIPDRRKQAYFNAGKYIVDHCDILIAVWNGDETKRKGGTKDVIDYAGENDRSVIIISSVDPADITMPVNKKLNAGSINQIDFFNSYNISPENEKRYVDNIYREYFLKNDEIPESKKLIPELTDFLQTDLFPYYAKASTIAKKYQLQYKRSGLYAYWLSTLAVIILGFAVVFKMFYQEAFILEFFILLSILVIIYRAHRNRAHTKWLENRFLVERIRVAPYFFISGLEISEISISPYRESRNESGQWMILAFAEIWDQLNYQWHVKNKQQTVYQSFTVDLVKYVNKSWIGGQINYHEGSLKNKKWYIRSKKWWNSFLELGGKFIFFAAMVSAAVHILINLSGNESFHAIEKLFTVLTLSLPLIAAAFEGVRRQKEYSRNYKRSEWMLDALKAKSKKYDKLVTGEDDAGLIENKFYLLLKETDELMLHENQDWMTLMVQSNLEYVT